jgi:hypothetical protein
MKITKCITRCKDSELLIIIIQSETYETDSWTIAWCGGQKPELNDLVLIIVLLIIIPHAVLKIIRIKLLF